MHRLFDTFEEVEDWYASAYIRKQVAELFKVGECYKLTHEYVGKHYRIFEAVLLKVESGKGLTRLTFRDIERNSKLYFYYPISKEKRYGIIKVEDK